MFCHGKIGSGKNGPPGPILDTKTGPGGLILVGPAVPALVSKIGPLYTFLFLYPWMHAAARVASVDNFDYDHS